MSGFPTLCVGAPAFIMPSAALFGFPLGRGLHFAPSPCCAESLVVRP